MSVILASLDFQLIVVSAVIGFIAGFKLNVTGMVVAIIAPTLIAFLLGLVVFESHVSWWGYVVAWVMEQAGYALTLSAFRPSAFQDLLARTRHMVE